VAAEPPSNTQQSGASAMKIRRFPRATFIAALGIALAPLAAAEEGRGTLDLAPSATIAQAVPDAELAKQRGGFMGIAFSATFVATVENLNGNVTGTGTGTTSTSGVTGTSPPVTYNISGGQVQLSSFIGNLSGLNGVFQLTSVNGVGNIVNSHLTLNVALVNLSAGTPIPSLQSLFGQ
jgi:hypothetical protein